uniref:Kinesin motor domain-containing protein n=1 Tax=Plectus sambesii TaxID=2011161 RepID=A0A914WDA9_9BILA
MADDCRSDDFIKVSVRVRPPAEILTGGGKLCVTTGNDGRSVCLLQPNYEERVFSFDAVFNEQTTQEAVFSSIGKRIIEGCVDGYNGTIFAYGQTGSGKTFTMLGPAGEESGLDQGRRGLIPRGIEYLFSLLERKREVRGDAFKYLCKCSFVELYNERLYDLLVSSASSQLKLRVDMQRGVFVEGAIEEIVSSSSEVHKVLQAGWMNRRIGETKMNRESSRSHAVFMLEIETQDMDGDLVNHKVARLNLVDLAGSERQKDAQSEGNTLKEANSINKSLSFLGRVIRTLSRRVSPGQPPVFVPYRDSQLTYLLKDSLGGNARTAVVANIHQNLRFFEETLSTLKFAEEVKKVRNKAVVNENVSGENVAALLREIQRMKEELRLLRDCSPRANITNELPPFDMDISASSSSDQWHERYKEAANEVVKCYAENEKLKNRLKQWKEYSGQQCSQVLSLRMQLRFREDSIKTLKASLNEKNIDTKHLDEMTRHLQEEIDSLKAQLEQRDKHQRKPSDDDVESSDHGRAEAFRKRLSAQASDRQPASVFESPSTDSELVIRRLRDDLAGAKSETARLQQETHEKDERHRREIERLQRVIEDGEIARKALNVRREQMNIVHDVTIKAMTPPRVAALQQQTPMSKKERRRTRFTPGTGSTEAVHASAARRSIVRPLLFSEEDDLPAEQTMPALPLDDLYAANQELEARLEKEEREHMRLELDVNRLDQLINERNLYIDKMEREVKTREADLCQQIADLQQRHDQIDARFRAQSKDLTETKSELSHLKTERARLDKELRANEIEFGELRNMCDARERAWQELSELLATSEEENVALRSKVETLQVLLEEQADRPSEFSGMVEPSLRECRPSLPKARVDRKRSSSISVDVNALQRKVSQLTEKSKDFDILMEECAKMREEQCRLMAKYENVKADCESALAERAMALSDIAKYEKDSERVAAQQAAQHAKLNDKITDLERRLVREAELAAERQNVADVEIDRLKFEIDELQTERAELQARLAAAKKQDALTSGAASVGRVTRSMAKTDAHVQALVDQMAEQDEIIASLQSTRDQQNAKMALLEAELARVTSEAEVKRESAVSEQVNKYQQKIDQFQQEFNVKTETLQAAQNRMTLAEQERVKAEKMLQKLKEQNNSLVSRLETSEKHCEQLKETAARLEALEKRSFEEQNRLRSDMESLREEKLNLNNTIAELRRRIDEEAEESARLASHANQRQKIHYVNDLRIRFADQEKLLDEAMRERAKLEKELAALKLGEPPKTRGEKVRLLRAASGSHASLASNNSADGKENVLPKPRK